MSKQKKKTRRDVAEIARENLEKIIGEKLNGEPLKDTTEQDDGKDQIFVESGRRGGLKGGRARAKSLSAEKRKQIAKRAARSRWDSKKSS